MTRENERKTKSVPNSRRPATSFVVYLASLGMLLLPAGAVAQSDGSGVEPITRDSLPPGIKTLVEDEAIDAVNSPEFDNVRLEWESHADLVSQVDYQLEFRAYTDFMRRDLTYLAELLTERPVNMGIERMGLYMSAQEATELKRRNALGDEMERLVEAITGVKEGVGPEGEIPEYGPDFGGIWQDQLDGGIIVLAVVESADLNVAELNRIAGGADNLKVVKQPYSYNDVENYRNQLVQELDELGIAHDVAATHNDKGRLLEFRVEDPASIPTAFGSNVPADAFSVVEGSPVIEAGYPDETHSWADQQPGLKIAFRTDSDWITNCGWGFNGHTSSYHYIVSAGHCHGATFENYSGNPGDDVQIWQNNSSLRIVASSPAWVVSVDTSSYDATRIQSHYADDNCYHGDTDRPVDPDCRWPMKERAWHNSWEVGNDQTCVSLSNSADYRCGFILEENHAGGNKVRVGVSAQGGDSGSGFKWDYRIDGVLTDIAIDGSEAFFQTAFHVQDVLGSGFNFNCADGETVRNDPGDWGVCPGVSG